MVYEAGDSRREKRVYNSEISILIYSVGQKFKPEHCLEFLDYLFNFDQSDVKIAKLAQAGFEIDGALLLTRIARSFDSAT